MTTRSCAAWCAAPSTWAAYAACCKPLLSLVGRRSTHCHPLALQLTAQRALATPLRNSRPVSPTPTGAMADLGSGTASPASTVALEPATPSPLLAYTPRYTPPGLQGEVPPALMPHMRPGDQNLNPMQYLRILAHRAYRQAE